MLKVAAPLWGLLLIPTSPAYANNDAEQKAMRTAIEAGTKQIGLDRMLNDWVKEQVPSEYLKWAGTVAPIVQTVSTQSIRLTWELP